MKEQTQLCHRTISPARAAFRIALIEQSLDAGEIAKAMGIKPENLQMAIRRGDNYFTGFRYRLGAERVLGKLIFTDPLESAQLAAISENLGVDLVTTPLRKIRAIAEKRKIEGLPTGRPRGFPIFKALLLHFFPDSPAAKNPHYVQA